MSNRTAEVDPRIAARREAVVSEKRRKRERWIIAVLVVIAALGGAWLLSRSALFDVDRITVEGTSRLSADDVLAAAAVQVGEPMLAVNSSEVARRVERLPWIASATVDRSISGELTIAVVERTAVATMVDESGTPVLVDGSGRVLGPPGLVDGPAIQIEGLVAGAVGTDVDGSAGALETAILLTPGVRSRVLAIVVLPDGNLELRLRPQGIVDLGPATNLLEKLASLTIVMGQVDQRDLARINLVNPETPVVSRTPK
jgi:cell division protein FtsQ